MNASKMPNCSHEVSKVQIYTVETEWPPTAHGGRHDEASRKEFDKYSRGAMNFFLRMTQKKDA